MLKTLFHIIWIILLFSVVDLNAQQEEFIINVNQAGVDEGLSHRNIRAVVKDDMDYIWVATENGLNRFNGSRFKSYTDQKYGIKIHDINDLFKDRTGKLWLIKTRQKNPGQIQIFDPYLEKAFEFEEIYGDEIKLDLNRIIDYRIQNDIIYFLENDNHLIIYDGSFRRTTLTLEAFFEICDIKTDSAGNILILSTSLDEKNVLVTLYSKDGKQIINQNYDEVESFAMLYHLGENDFGFLLKEKDSGKLAAYKISSTVSIEHDLESSRLFNSISGFFKNFDRDLFQYFGENYLLITYDEDLYFFDYKSRFVKNLTEEYEILHSIQSVFVDETGTIWLSSHFGLIQLNIKKNRFSQLMNSPNQNLINIRRIVEDDQGDLWVLQDKERTLYRISFQDKSFKHPQIEEFDDIQDSFKFSNKPPYYTLEPTPDKNLGIIYQEEYVEIDPLSYEVSTQKTGSKLIHEYAIWLLFYDSKGNIWYANDQANVSRRVGGEYEQVCKLTDNNDLCQVYQMLEIETNEFLIASDAGLHLFDPVSLKVTKHYSNQGEGLLQIPCTAVYHIHETDQGYYWLATNNGLIKWSRHEGVLEHYTTNNGLSSNTVYAVYSDQLGRLWLPSSYGLMLMDPQTKEISVFLEKDGIPHNEFNRQAHESGKDGSLYFGTMNGLIAFNPSNFDLHQQSSHPVIRLNKFEQYDSKEKRIVDKSLLVKDQREIILQPRDPFLNFSFDILSYDFEENHKITYKIEGLDPAWNILEGNKLRINRLPFGNYMLRVRGISHEGQYTSNELNFAIKSKQPLFLNYWFIAIITAVVMILTFLLYRWRLHYLTMRKLVLERRIAERTSIIEKDKIIIEEQAERLKELDKAKSRFFANISHELRTPLTLIIEPLRKMIRESSNQELKNGLNIPLRNSRILLDQVNQLLSIVKLESGTMKLHKRPMFIEQHLRTLLESFEPLAKSKGVELKFEKGGVPPLALWDGKKMERIIYNLLSNSFKFTSKGFVALKLDYAESTKHLIIEIVDSGIGISKENLQKIFDRFQQVENVKYDSRMGTGIGLSLVKDLVDLHNGSIEVESEPGLGTRFIIKLPVEIVESSNESPAKSTQYSMEELIPVVPGVPIIIKSIPLRIGAKNELDRNKQNVLLVEDNLELRHFLSDLLKNDFNVSEAKDGKEGIEMARLDIPDIIISDVMMPKVDGLELTHSLKTDLLTSHVPIILLTAKSELDSRLHGLLTGADDYLAKPFHSEELMIRVKNLLDNRARIRNKFKQPEWLSKKKKDKSISSLDQDLLSRMDELIKSNLSDPDFSVDYLAKQVFMSRSQLFRKLKGLIGKTPNEYIRESRLQYALEISNEENLSLIQLAERVGYKDERYFQKRFKEHFGFSPT